MLELQHVTNGTGKVSVVVLDTERDDVTTLALTVEEAFDLAAQLIIKARNLQDGTHDSTAEYIEYSEAGIVGARAAALEHALTIMHRYYCLCGWSLDTTRHAHRVRIAMHNLKHIVLGRI